MGISVNDSRLAELARLIDEWPGLVSAPAGELIDDCLVLVSYLSDVTTLVDVGSGGGMPGLAELCLPFVRVGGRLLAQKTRDEDVGAAARAIELLGGGPARVEPAPSRARSAGVVV